MAKTFSFRIAPSPSAAYRPAAANMARATVCKRACDGVPETLLQPGAVLALYGEATAAVLALDRDDPVVLRGAVERMRTLLLGGWPAAGEQNDDPA